MEIMTKKERTTETRDQFSGDHVMCIREAEVKVFVYVENSVGKGYALT